jgi:hypothetical protein
MKGRKVAFQGDREYDCRKKSFWCHSNETKKCILKFDLNAKKFQLRPFCASQGCQIFLDTICQKDGKYTYQITTTLPDGHKIYQMTVKYSK